ncbi:MAG TPA: Hpt domain-containing protein, partial [Pyrinomonadaceae bacterium]
MIDAEPIQAFLEEAESYLPIIRGGILISASNGGAGGEIETSLRQIHTIKGAAAMVGLKELSGAAEELESEIRAIIEKNRFLNEQDSLPLLDCLARIEALLLEKRFQSDGFALDIDSFIDESFDNLQINKAAKQSKIGFDTPAEDFSLDDLTFAERSASFRENAETSEEEFEIDEELLEIFRLEAEDLLRSIAANLETLEKQPANGEALMEIRRNAHTFKGSAGIVGLKKPSELAHRVEDLLDYIAEREICGDRRIFELILAATDCLSEMVGGSESSEQSTKKIARIYRNFDDLMRTLAASESKEPADESETTQTETEPNATIAPCAGGGQKPAAQQQKSVVRVSLEKLDDLMKIVRDLTISRSVFEQRLGELDYQIEELERSTRRLQRSTNRLETEFEVDMLGDQISKLKVQSSKFHDSNQELHVNTAPEFDALEFDRYTEFHRTTRELGETTGDASAIGGALDNLRG